VIEYLLASGEDDKGEITRKKIELVNMSVFRGFAEKIKLPDFVFWGAGEQRQRIWESGRVSAECFEALCGAAYLDGGMTAVKIILMTAGGFTRR
ncbi:MAG TPA: ribonuclease III domain-containing protein, partial [Methanocorpusculum sp.]|nr:ribonuclease III domain-containing protein [Methanocorpusculum sp.]